MRSAGNRNRIARQQARLRRSSCGHGAGGRNQDSGESGQPSHGKLGGRGMIDMRALKGQGRSVSRQRLGRLDIPGRAQGRSVPRHLRFHCECKRQQTKAAGEQNAAQCGHGKRMAQHINGSLTRAPSTLLLRTRAFPTSPDETWDRPKRQRAALGVVRLPPPPPCGSPAQSPSPAD